MRDGETARSRGFAFMTFESGTSVNAVMAREHYLDGKTVRSLFAFSPFIHLITFVLYTILFSRRSTLKELSHEKTEELKPINYSLDQFQIHVLRNLSELIGEVSVILLMLL